MKQITFGILVLVLMITMPAAQSVLAKKHHHLTDTEQEAGIASDSQGRVCDFGPSHDECHDQFLERTNNLPEIQSNQHYGGCEERGNQNELACDILNNDGSPNP